MASTYQVCVSDGRPDNYDDSHFLEKQKSTKKVPEAKPHHRREFHEQRTIDVSKSWGRGVHIIFPLTLETQPEGQADNEVKPLAEQAQLILDLL